MDTIQNQLNRMASLLSTSNIIMSIACALGALIIAFLFSIISCLYTYKILDACCGQYVSDLQEQIDELEHGPGGYSAKLIRERMEIAGKDPTTDQEITAALEANEISRIFNMPTPYPQLKNK